MHAITTVLNAVGTALDVAAAFLNTTGVVFWNYSTAMLVQTGTLVIILLMLDLFLKRRVRAVFRYWVWMLVLIKLISPPTMSLPTGIVYWCARTWPVAASSLQATPVPFFQAEPDVPESDTFGNMPPGENETISITSSYAHSDHALPASKKAASSLTWWSVLAALWLLGVIALSTFVIQRVVLAYRMVKSATPPDKQLLAIFDECLRLMNIRRPIGLGITDALSSPAVCGILHPVVLLPPTIVNKLDPTQLRAVLIHELTHVVRGDLAVQAMQTVLQILHFYNPFVWLANAMIRRTREQAVDETVLVTLGRKPSDYSSTLLQVATMAIRRPAMGLGLIGVVESKSALAGRIRHILSRPVPRSAKLGLTGAMAVLVLAVTTLPMAGANPKQSSSAEVKSTPPATTQPQLAVEEAGKVATVLVSQPNPPKIKVGLMMSHFTATGPTWVGHKYGYADQVRILTQLCVPEIETFPVIEPDTESLGEIPDLLTNHCFGGRKPINAADVNELSKLDVLVVSRGTNMKDEVLSAMHDAVTRGMGLLTRQNLGNVTPEYTPTVVDISGMSACQYAWNPEEVECEIVGDHPLLGKLSGQIGTKVKIVPNGAYGLLRGVPLIRVKSMSKVHAVGSNLVRRQDYVFYPLYMSQLGKGRIVGGCFAAYAPYPVLQKATDNLFILRCVEWLAGRPLKELDDSIAMIEQDQTTQPSEDVRDGSAADFATEAAACHMRLILMNIATYDSEQKAFPTTLNDLVTTKIAMDDGKYVFRNPRTNINPGFIFVKPTGTSQMSDITSPATTPILYELTNGQPDTAGLIGYADGHVEMPAAGR